MSKFRRMAVAILVLLPLLFVAAYEASAQWYPYGYYRGYYRPWGSPYGYYPYGYYPYPGYVTPPVG